MNRIAHICLALILCGTAVPAIAVNYTVGADGNCGYSTIAAALAAAKAQYTGSRPVIYVASNKSYSGQALTMSGISFSLIGGVADCSHLTPTGQTTISGTGGASVISVTGNSVGQLVKLSHLIISSGGGGTGGGINFDGAGAMTIDHTIVLSNNAGYGAGMNFKGTGGAADLYINAETQFLYNNASTSGGGIRVESTAWLHVLAADTLVAENSAGSYGGGIEVIGPAQADLGSPGTQFFGSQVGFLYHNRAAYGGGLSVNGGAGGSQDAYVRMFATDAHLPVRIEGNVATHTGGGIYMQPDNHTNASYVALCATGYRIDGNSAPEGTAIYLDEDYTVANGYIGAEAALFEGAVDDNSCKGDPPASLGKVACVDETCNSIDGNLAQTAGAPGTYPDPSDPAARQTAGSTVLAQTNADFGADRIRMQNNHGAQLVRVESPDGGVIGFTVIFVSLSNCLMTGNMRAADLVEVAGGATNLHIDNCTFANNQITDAVLKFGNNLDLTNSIVAQGPLKTINAAGANSVTIDSVISLEVASLASGTHVMQADPAFLDVAHGDFHLSSNSPAIDFAPAESPSGVDLDGNPHDVDMTANPDRYGVRDLGAYERQSPFNGCGAADTIFCNGFEP